MSRSIQLFRDSGPVAQNARWGVQKPVLVRDRSPPNWADERRFIAMLSGLEKRYRTHCGMLQELMTLLSDGARCELPLEHVARALIVLSAYGL